MIVDVTFPGGLAVDAHYRGFTISTDQSPRAGGAGAAPSPFDLFLASIATCAGVYALRFCQQRDIDTTGLSVRLEAVTSDPHGMIPLLRLALTLPGEFPDKYRDAIVRAVDQCTVKRHILQPPAFEIVLANSLVASER